MNLNEDLSQRIVRHAESLAWQPSPQGGVMRRMLERHGAELARATSIVRFAPGAFFPSHEHGLGEECFVIEGVFEDAAGRYGPGTYLRNPPGSSHAPSSAAGCTLFVKLRYGSIGEGDRIVVDSTRSAWHPGMVEGLQVLPLSAVGTEHTALVRWAPGTHFHAHRHWGGEEILVLDGVFEDEHGHYPVGTWIRSPHMSVHQPFSTQGCTILVKTGHLVPTDHAHSRTDPI
jgi:anti-sigma factor ChrR (cupin superfamily)